MWVEGEEASGFDGVQVCFCLASHVFAKLHIYFLIINYLFFYFKINFLIFFLKYIYIYIFFLK